MALDPRSAARTAVLTPVGLGVLAFDATSDWATQQGHKANSRVEERVAPVATKVTTKVKSLLDEARAEAKPTAQQLASLARRGNGAPSAKKSSGSKSHGSKASESKSPETD
jgi:hypothetical protein